MKWKLKIEPTPKIPNWVDEINKTLDAAEERINGWIRINYPECSRERQNDKKHQRFLRDREHRRKW